MRTSYFQNYRVLHRPLLAPPHKAVFILGGICIVAFFITYPNRSIFFPVLGFAPVLALGHLMAWQFFTSIFLHGDLGHLVVNLLSLFFLGREIERSIGWRKSIRLFLVAGAGGSLLVGFSWILGLIPNVLCVGSSGAIFGLLGAFARINPRRTILVFFLVPIRIFHLAVLVGIFEMARFGVSQGVSALSHFGGLAAGFLYLPYLYKGLKKRQQTVRRGYRTPEPPYTQLSRL